MSTVPAITLDNGVEIPQLGLGVWQVEDEIVTDVVKAAFESGYRHIDTAAIYGNEEGVGRAIADSGLPRDELFITTKVWNSDQGYDSTLRAFDASLGRLGLDSVDLYLIHWQALKKDKYVETWKAFEQLYADKRVRAIGVSNFHIPALQRLFDETDLRPTVNQIELHPALPQDELRAFNAENDIVTESWSPLASGELLGDPTLKALADKHSKSQAQVVIRWHLQLGNVVIPKSKTPSRIAENIAVFDFTLDNDDMAAIADLETGVRTGGDPDTFG
ncbi:diketogulonate reductase-like aldo/keto reductase [Kribbella orskensis]|uniref:Diketogulonate reductase-like aldo/keto reductase n=1 Tax=Kribbella orskensis TaxID=2512216 RepID=A0ABY2BFY1_9ACTN|nr:MULTISPECIES: aldo/keto reductase [Kribbella]TCN37004.1 diketogulonate reductase-like aldo/keto reductase [Kribbella sp. VKM Ac-2500]TCO18429.1 diketogulonate reductase-like aldo/keto reductase [Kribbella orskensis]